MPALTFMHSTTQRHQNCGVFHARSTPTLALVIIGLGCTSGSQPAGFQPWLFVLALGSFVIGNLEGVAVMLTRDAVDEHVGSLFRRGVAHCTR